VVNIFVDHSLSQVTPDQLQCTC